MTDWTQPSPENKAVAILGVGSFGRRVALTWILGGFNVHAYDPSVYSRNATTLFIAHNTTHPVKPAIRPQGELRVFDSATAAIEDAWLVVEAVPDRLSSKTEVFDWLSHAATPESIVATTSTMHTSREIADSLKNSTIRSRMLNMHYSQPIENRLVELMSSGTTNPNIISFLFDRLTDCNLAPIVARKESMGFVIDRVWTAVKREVLLLLSEGVATPQEVDDAWRVQFDTTAKGPCARMDDAGLDSVKDIEQHYSSVRSLVNSQTTQYLDGLLQERRSGARSRNGGLFAPGTNRDFDPDSIGEQAKTHAPLIFVLDLGTAVEHPSRRTGRVCLGSPDMRPLQVLVAEQFRPDGIDVSITTGRMYWTLMGTPGKNDGFIRSCDIQGGQPTDFVPAGIINTPKQIAIDHENSTVYISDREGMKVWRCNLDGSGLEIIVQAGDPEDKTHHGDQSRWCVGICVSPATKKFYWTQKGPSKGNKGRIFRANFAMPAGKDATTRSDIECLFENLPEPIDLEIDEDNQVLWWTDRGDYPTGNSLNLADLKRGIGNLEIVVVARHFHEAIGLKIDWVNQHVYLTDIGGTVYMLDTNGKKKRKLYDIEDSAFSGICLVKV